MSYLNSKKNIDHCHLMGFYACFVLSCLIASCHIMQGYQILNNSGPVSVDLPSVFHLFSPLPFLWAAFPRRLKFPTQGPHSQMLMMGEGGSYRGSYFIPKIITTSEVFSTQKKLPLFLAYPKKSLSPFFATQKNPGVFHRPKKNDFWPKFQTQKNHWEPPSSKYVGWPVGFPRMATSLSAYLHIQFRDGH